MDILFSEPLRGLTKGPRLRYCLAKLILHIQYSKCGSLRQEHWYHVDIRGLGRGRILDLNLVWQIPKHDGKMFYGSDWLGWGQRKEEEETGRCGLQQTK